MNAATLWYLWTTWRGGEVPTPWGRPDPGMGAYPDALGLAAALAGFLLFFLPWASCEWCRWRAEVEAIEEIS
jgi:hypothetical protein